MRLACLTLLATLTLASRGFGRLSDTPANSAFLPAQAAADVLREAAGTDGAFLGAEQLKETYSKQNLASLLTYPAEKLVVVSMTGAQLKSAFERSLAVYPQDNPNFLQLSGFEVTFSKTAEANSRVVKATAGGSPIDDHKTYTVAMSEELGNGAMGYYKVWDKGQITKSLDKTLESILLGKPFVTSAPRYSPQ